MVEKDEKIINDVYLMIHSSIEIPNPHKSFDFENIHHKDKTDLIVNVMICSYFVLIIIYVYEKKPVNFTDFILLTKIYFVNSVTHPF